MLFSLLSLNLHTYKSMHAFETKPLSKYENDIDLNNKSEMK